jgi:AcrR family transcriptional regulator
MNSSSRTKGAAQSDPEAKSSRRASTAETRRRLLDAGRQAFAVKGLDGTNLVQDILEPSGVSVGSFYHQFTDKTDLLVALLDDALQLARSTIDDAQQPESGWSPHTVAHEAYDRLLKMVDDDEDLVRIQLRESNHPDTHVSEPLAQIRRLWIDALATGFRRLGQPGVAFDAELAAELVAALGHGILRYYLDLDRQGRKQQRKRLVDGLVSFTLAGFVGLTDLSERARPAKRTR